MASSDEVQSYLRQLFTCLPRHLYDDLDAAQRGAGLVLSCLQRAAEPMRSGELASRLNVSSARIAALLNRMERSGLVARYPSAEDGRITLVSITPQGEAQADELRCRAMKGVERLLDEVGQQDLDTFIRIARRMADVLDS